MFCINVRVCVYYINMNNPVLKFILSLFLIKCSLFRFNTSNDDQHYHIADYIILYA